MKTSIVLLASSLILVAMPFAAADESKADCEPGQAWIGYTTTAGFAAAYNAAGRPGGVHVCEGEHWDGQDEVSSNSGGNSNVPSCVSQSGDDVAVCMTPTESKDGQGEAIVGARVSNDGVRHYVGVNLPIGYATLFVDENGVVAVYLRDNTPGNPLATAVSAAGITKGFPSESDCDQATYEKGAYDPNPATQRTHCGRDNTAITVTILK